MKMIALINTDDLKSSLHVGLYPGDCSCSYFDFAFTHFPFQLTTETRSFFRIIRILQMD
jgi:hypothetical protein